MQISLGKDTSLVEMTSGTAKIHLKTSSVDLNDYIIDFPGEYERSLIFVEARQCESGLVYIITLEGQTAIYLPPETTVASLETLRDVNNKDLVIMSASETLWKTVETWEASVVITYGAGVDEFMKKLGQSVEPVASIMIKSADFEGDVTKFVALA